MMRRKEDREEEEEGVEDEEEQIRLLSESFPRISHEIQYILKQK